MKAIKLHTAAVDNGGTRRDAPDVLTIGPEKDQVDMVRAKALVALGSAVDATPAEKAKAEK